MLPYNVHLIALRQPTTVSIPKKSHLCDRVRF